MNSEEISVDDSGEIECGLQTDALKLLPNWPPINIDFQDIVYSVNGNKVILRGVSGNFKSNQLTAILGPSGAGKSTLLNVLAGYKCSSATGAVSINGQPRDMKVFRKMSRYIMQQDIYQPMLTVREAMRISADLKLGNKLTNKEKNDIIDEILDLLRLNKSADTMSHKLSGGERKRLSIALELVNNPPVIFLDEPTTGLDDLSSSQCISLLRRIAHNGRTIICSIHTPSAKIFAMFDHVYIVASGQCVYQGHGSNIVPYMNSIGLNCPLTYNPADFAIEVSCGEYGTEYIDRMVTSIDNGRCYNWKPALPGISGNNHTENTMKKTNGKTMEEINYFIEEINPECLKARASSWEQFRILHKRMTVQMWRDSNYLQLRVYLHIFLGFVVGGLFFQMGNDASKTLYNFGFCFTIIITFMYIPMMPILLQFPGDMLLLKREHFNRWYRLNVYYWAMLAAKLPMQIGLAIMYVTMVYFMTDQPIDVRRMCMFYAISVLISLASESLGLLIASRLNIVNAMFIGPVCTVPMMLLAVYGIGYGKTVFIPWYLRVFMSLSYLRYGLEGIIAAIYGYERNDMVCPTEEVYCQFQKAKYTMVTMGFHNVDFTVSVIALFGFYVIFNCFAYYLIRQRLSLRSSNNVAVQYIGRLIKRHLNFVSFS